MDEQPAPSASQCPHCGGDPEHDPRHVLSAMGYTHDDVRYTCSECGEHWDCGVPIGEYHGERAAELFCDSCEERYGLPHRLKVRDNGIVILHMKCPNPECYYFWTLRRPLDETGLMLYGYPQITGAIHDTDEDVQPYGYDPEEV